jgi:hypothetical protein
MTHFDPRDPRQMAALLVFMEYGADEIVDVLVRRYNLTCRAAVDLTAELLKKRIEHADKPEAVRKSHLAAIAAEFDLSKSMHDPDQ